MNTRVSWLCALLAAGTHSLHAQALPPRDTLLFHAGPIIVDAGRAAITTGGASAVTAPLRSLRLPAAPSLADAVRALPFAHVRTNARGEAYFGMRGSGQEAREVAVLLDGLPLSLNFDHRADLATLPMSGAGSVTLVRGLPSLLFGPNVLGGVVEISTSATGGSGTAAVAQYDRTGAYAAHASVTRPLTTRLGLLQLRAAAGHREADGWELPRGAAGPLAARDGLRLNSDHRLTDGFVAARFTAPSGWLSVLGSAYRAERGAPPELDAPMPRFWRYPSVERALGALSAGTAGASPLGGAFEAQGSFGYDVAHSELVGYTNATYETENEREDADDRTLTGRMLFGQTVGGRARLSLAGTYADVRRAETLTPGGAADYRQRLWSGALETALQLPASLTLTVGGAWDAADTPETGGRPAVAQRNAWGARAGLLRSGRSGDVVVHAGVSRRARFPSLRELYSGALGRVEPNPELGPEYLRAAEAGVMTRVARGHVQVTAFHHLLDDAIVRTMVNRRVKRVNRDRTRSSGLELMAAQSFGDVALSLDATAQDVESEDGDTDVAYRTEYQPKFAGGARATVAAPWETRLYAGVRGEGSQYCLAAGGSYRRLAPSARMHAGAGRAWGRLAVGVDVDNVTDAASWDQCGLPRPGRTLRLSVRVGQPGMR